MECLVTPRDVLVEEWLVLLDRELVMATPVDDLGGDVFLTTHGVDGHHGPVGSIASKSGMAVISLDLASVGSLPRSNERTTAQALTTCRAERPTVRRGAGVWALPSMAIGVSSGESVATRSESRSLHQRRHQEEKPF